MKEFESLKEVVTEMLLNIQKDFSSDDWKGLEYSFYKFLEKETANNIYLCLKQDENLDFPFHISCDMFQKIVFLDPYNVYYLHEFANFLRIRHGNSWHYLADYFDKVALDISKNRLINKSILG